MKKLVFGALFGLLAACGSSGDKNKIVLPDSGSGDGGVGACNVLTQTGCMAGEKCTWFEDATTPTPLGHIGCAPAGSAATGAACTYGAPGATGYDNCVGGDVCNGAKCKLICDQSGGAPTCSGNTACAVYDGLFGPEGQASAAGVCDPTCDPLGDNDFDGSGALSTKTGSACAAGEGCYGEPDSKVISHYSCSSEFNTTLGHRAPCTATAKSPGSANACANATGPYINGCAQGYVPLLYDAVGSMQVDCIAMCKPANCYSGNCGTNNGNLPGDPASNYQCSAQHEIGTFNTATTGNNGDQCMYSWFFETDDTTGALLRSPESDLVGFCVDHTKVEYDSNGDGSADAPWPICSSFTTVGVGTGSAVAGVCNAANGCVGAAAFGCVDTTTGGIMFAGKKPANPVRIDHPRMLYHRAIR